MFPRTLLGLCVPLLAFAQAIPPAAEKRIADLEAAVKSAQSAGDNAWMLVSAALVLMMTGPGLALFYGGLVRAQKRPQHHDAQLRLMAVVTVLWALVGYSFAFADGNPFIGGFDYLFLNGVGAAPNADYAATIPQQTFMIYQLMFAIITPALISGAFAERMKFSAMLLFTVLWMLIVYFPWRTWSGAKADCSTPSWAAKFRCFDFAGGTVVHITSGVSALVCALYLGKRVGYPVEPMKPHSLVHQRHRRMLAVGGLVRIQRRQRAGGLFAGHQRFCRDPFRRRRRDSRLDGRRMDPNGKPSMLGAISGAVAGLVAITPASGFVKPFPALLIGFIAGIVCYLMVTVVKGKFGYDDTLDAFGVHGAGGTLGAILTGVFATSLVNPDSRMPAAKCCPSDGSMASRNRSCINWLES